MLEKVIAIAKEAGKIIMDVRAEGFEFETKSHAFDFVTTADIKAEEYIVEQILRQFPEHSILSEERDFIDHNSEYVWMIDPVDGTKYFKNGLDDFSVMIGLCKNGQPILAEGIAELSFTSAVRGAKWDTCGPQVILEEAGGKLTDIDGDPLDYNQSNKYWEKIFVATNGVLHDAVLAEIKKQQETL
jgi:fructose-1,6-bisphosphatase/inositol monophosphatase family enzyme